MQVVIFDKFFKCGYRLHNVPRDWNFLQIAELLELQHPANEYQAIRLDDSAEFCMDDYVYKDEKLVLTGCNCS